MLHMSNGEKMGRLSYRQKSERSERAQAWIIAYNINKMLSYRRETALQGA